MTSMADGRGRGISAVLDRQGRVGQARPRTRHEGPRDRGNHGLQSSNDSLYGLAQSPALWYDTIDEALVAIGFRPTQSDPLRLRTRKRQHSRHLDAIRRRHPDQRKGPRARRLPEKRAPRRLRKEGHGRSQPNSRHGGHAQLRRRISGRFAEGLHQEHPGKVRKGELQPRQHSRVRTGTLDGSASGQATWSSRIQDVPVHHKQPAVPDPMHKVRPKLCDQPADKGVQQSRSGFFFVQPYISPTFCWSSSSTTSSRSPSSATARELYASPPTSCSARGPSTLLSAAFFYES